MACISCLHSSYHKYLEIAKQSHLIGVLVLKMPSRLQNADRKIESFSNEENLNEMVNG